jgi:hypothetical protein
VDTSAVTAHTHRLWAFSREFFEIDENFQFYSDTITHAFKAFTQFQESEA